MRSHGSPVSACAKRRLRPVPRRPRLEYDTFRPFIDSFVDDARRRGVTVDQRMFEGVDHGFYYDKSTPEPMLRSLMASIHDHLLTRLG